MRLLWIVSVLILVAFVTGSQVRAQVGEESGYPYAPEKPISGELELVGSTLMQQLASLWLEDFRGTHPEVQVGIDCRGSESAFPELKAERPIVGMFSRSVSPEELARAGAQQKQVFQAVVLGHDVLAVIVHPENPIDVLRWDSVRSSLWRREGETPLERWSDFGAETPFGDEAVRFYLPGKEHGLRALADRFLIAGLNVQSETIHEIEIPADIPDAIARHRNGIALVSATRARNRRVKILPVQTAANRGVSPLDEEAPAKGYPLIRELSVVFAVEPNGKRHPVIEEFLRFVLSRRGQRIVSKDGFVPLEAALLDTEREKLGWEVIK